MDRSQKSRKVTQNITCFNQGILTFDVQFRYSTAVAKADQTRMDMAKIIQLKIVKIECEFNS
jgi:hypothetical protein